MPVVRRSTSWLRRCFKYDSFITKQLFTIITKTEAASDMLSFTKLLFTITKTEAANDTLSFTVRKASAGETASLDEREHADCFGLKPALFTRLRNARRLGLSTTESFRNENAGMRETGASRGRW